MIAVSQHNPQDLYRGVPVEPLSKVVEVALKEVKLVTKPMANLSKPRRKKEF